MEVNTDSRSYGLANIGVVAASDYYETGLTQNPALLSRNEKVAGVLSSLINPAIGIPDYILDIGIYHSLNEKMTLGFSYKYMSWGELFFMDHMGNYYQMPLSKEINYGLIYSYSINSNLSVGIGLEYIYIDMLSDVQPFVQVYPAKALAADFGIDYRNKIKMNENKYLRYDFGASILNIGNKMKYCDTLNAEFLPAIIKLGTMWTYVNKGKENTTYNLDIAYQIEKLLTPSYINGISPYYSVPSSLWHSFSDSPDGFKGELSEINHLFGIENRFIFNNKFSFSFRLGHMKHLVLNGIGITYKFIYLDYSYIIMNKKYSFNNDSKYIFTIGGILDPCLTLGIRKTFE